MAINTEALLALQTELKVHQSTLVAVSKTKPYEDIAQAFGSGQLHFGENYIQELNEKITLNHLPLKWHFIGHLQSNKVKLLKKDIHLIHAVHSISLLKAINKHGAALNHKFEVLLQLHVAQETTKHGFDPSEMDNVLATSQLETLEYINIRGIMGMATFTSNEIQIAKEFKKLFSVYVHLKNQWFDGVQFNKLSMGMSSDYKIALAEGSNMVRIGSAIFGNRN